MYVILGFTVKHKPDDYISTYAKQKLADVLAEDANWVQR